MKPTKIPQEEIIISTDKSLLDVNLIFDFIVKSYWGKGRIKDLVEKSIENSLCFGIYHKNKQVGFARIITDFTFFAYLLDIFIIKEYRGLGLSKLLMEEILDNPQTKNIKNWMLKTKDAHGLYNKFGFTSPKSPEKIMEYKIV